MNSLNSATKSFIKFKEAIENVSESLNQTSREFARISEQLVEMTYKKNVEQDRILYLKEIHYYTGYKITLFADIKNV